VEKVIKDLLKETAKGEDTRLKEWEKPHVSESSYVSYVVVDLKDNEITIASKDKFSLPKTPVTAGTG